MKASTKKYVIDREYPISKENAWNLLSDTNRLNLYIGLFPVNFSDIQKDNKGVLFREAQAKVGGLIPISWQEYPFQWEEKRSYVVERRYLTGPLKHFIGGVELLDSDDGSINKTKIRLTAEFIAQNVLGSLAIHFTGVKSMKNTFKYIDHFLKIDPKAITEAPQKSPLHKVNEKELNRLSNSLKKWPVKTRYIDMLREYLIIKSDHDVANMEPILIAKLWDADPDEVLRLFLYATKTGMLNLSWNLICPNCRVSKVSQNSLSSINKQFHCDLCGINYDTTFDQYVELYFAVHSSIREAHSEVYCVGGPMITPHIKIQKVIESGSVATFPMLFLEESLRLRVFQKNDIVTINKDTITSPKSAAIDYTDQGWSQSQIFAHSSVEVHNSSSNDLIMVLEQSTWSKDKVSAARVSAMQEFRDLFSSEVLSPGQSIGINHVTILFTDLKDSTSLYENIGDANAYGQVRRHFEFLNHWIAKNNGSVVKTIGDAVMAVFHLPEDGLMAAWEIQRNLAEFNDKTEEKIVLKIGLNSGPAIVVNSNDRLDYFGRTVNLSARIQAQGIGNDIVFSKEFMKQLKVAELLKSIDSDLNFFQATLKGIDRSMNLYRLTMKEF